MFYFWFSVLCETCQFDYIPLVYFCCFGRLMWENICKVDVRECFAYVLFQEFRGVLSYIWVFKAFWVYFHAWCDGAFQFNWFVCSCPGFPAVLAEKYCLFPILYSCLFCQRLIDHRCIDLFLGSLFYSNVLYVSFGTSTTLSWLLWLCNIVWSLGELCLLLVPSPSAP